MYYKFSWPEYQEYMEHPDFREECYYCADKDVYFIPEYIVEEVSNKDIEFEGIVFNIGNELEKDKKVLFEDLEGNRWIDICIAKGGAGLPPLFKRDNPLTGFIIGIE